jgi:rhomboid family GlyGly-CTERM serine protease
MIFAFGEHAAGALQCDRAAIMAGQWYRLVTAHWTHWSGDHLLWDVLTFALLGYVCEKRNAAKFLATVFASAIVVSLANLALLPTMQTYRGFSGIDSALFALLAVSVARESLTPRRWRVATVALSFLAAFVAKVAIEMFTGQTIFVDSAASGFSPVPMAHVVGATVGGVIALVPKWPGSNTC